MTEINGELAFKIVQNTNRQQFLETIRVLWSKIDYKLLSEIGQLLALKQLENLENPVVDAR